MTIFTRAGLPAILALALMSGAAFAQAPATPAPAAGSATAAPPAAGSTPAAPSNEVGEQFEIPRVGDTAQQVELITGLCGVQMKAMSPAACKCLAEQSLTTLSDPQRDYMIATAVAPPVADRMLNDRRVGQVDQEVIFRFISASSEGCASGTFDAEKQKAAMMPATPPAAPMATPPAAAPAPAAPATPAVPATPAAPASPATPTPAPAN